MHCRDLKPENFLLSDKGEMSPLKATDFGLSVFYKPGQVFTDVVGSAYYVAPEVTPPKAPASCCFQIHVIHACAAPLRRCVCVVSSR